MTDSSRGYEVAQAIIADVEAPPERMGLWSRIKRLVVPRASETPDPSPVAEHLPEDIERMFAAALISLPPEICKDYTDVIHHVTSQYIRFRDGIDPLPEAFQTPSRDA